MTNPAVQGLAFSVHTFSGFAGFTAASIVVGTLAGAAGWWIALFSVGTFGLLYTVFSAIGLEPLYHKPSSANSEEQTNESGENRSFLGTLQRPGILAMLAYFLVTTFASKGIQTFSTVLATSGFGFDELIGNTLLTAFFGFGSVGILADRYASARIITAALTIGSSILLLTMLGVIRVSPLSLVGLFGLIGFFTSLAFYIGLGLLPVGTTRERTPGD